MNHKDWRDFTTYAFAGLILFYASWYLAKHPSDISFATWATVSGSIVCLLKFLDIKDDKQKDAQ